MSCPICLRGAGLHDRCRDVLDVRLDRMPGLYVLLGAAMEPGSAVGDRVSGSRTPPLPARLEPLSLRAKGGIVTILATWETDWRETRGLAEPPTRGDDARSLAGITAFLRIQLDWAINEHPAVDEFAAEVRDIARSCYGVLGLNSTAMRIGDCPADDEEFVTCGKPLYADPYADVIRCSRCRARWDRPQWMVLGKAMNDGRAERAAQQPMQRSH